MGVVKTSPTGKQKSCLMMVFLMVIGTMPLIYSIPSAEASVSGDVAITGSTPVENDRFRYASQRETAHLMHAV